MKATILIGDVLDRIQEIPDETVQCVVTSPPYWGQRDYGCDGQIGLESNPQKYINKMVQVFREIRRILKNDGVLWVNLGDSYAYNVRGTGGPSSIQTNNTGSRFTPRKLEHGLKPKDLIGIPWRVAFGLQEDGWWLRQDVIWHKPRTMPESVTDRCTKAHEYLFMLTKSAQYEFDNQAMRESSTTSSKNGTRNRRSVWSISPKPFRGAHFAVMPEELCKPPILATSKPNDIVFDPFTGSGTVATVALRHGRNYLGIELNPEYTEIAVNRIHNDQPMLNEIEIK